MEKDLQDEAVPVLAEGFEIGLSCIHVCIHASKTPGASILICHIHYPYSDQQLSRLSGSLSMMFQVLVTNL